MINIPLEKIKERILEETDINEESLDKKIKEKLQQLSGLISEQGAAHIVANELGVKLVQTSGRLQVSNIVAGLKNVETAGKVVRAYEINEFTTKDGREGKVGNFILGDDTGTIRVVCWNEKADFVEKMDQGDVIHIKGGYVRENQGKAEIHMNDRAELKINPDGLKIDFEVQDVGPSRKKLEDLEASDDYVEVLATIVQIFDIRFFEVYSDSGKRVRDDDDGTEDTEFSYVMNIVVDDGTDNVRCVFWRRQTQRLLGLEDEEIQEFRDDMAKFEEVKNGLLGNIVKLKGSVKQNEGFERLELVARYVEKNPDPEEEIKKLNAEADKVKTEATDKDGSDDSDEEQEDDVEADEDVAEDDVVEEDIDDEDVDESEEDDEDSSGSKASSDKGKEKKKASVSKEALDSGMIEEEDIDDDMPSIDDL